MLSLTPTLLAAQKQASAVPYVRAIFDDYFGDATRIRLQRHYTGAEDDYLSAVVGAPDGSLVRARIDPATHVLYTQRVTSPGSTSSFSSWTSQGTVSSTGAVALAADDSNVFLFYVHTDDLTLKLKQSSDNGATYGSVTNVATASASVSYLAAAVSPSGDRLLLWVEGATVYTSRYSGGSWSSRPAWSNTAASITGIAVRHWLDFDVVICGTEDSTGDAKVWTAIYGDGVEQAPDDWSGLSEVTTANAGSNVSFQAPAVELLQQWRLFFVETYSGDLAHSRLQWSTMDASTTFTNQLWREPVAFDYQSAYGVAITASNLEGYFWLSSPSGVWSGLSPSNPELDVSGDVVEASVEVKERGGSARLVLRNDALGSSSAGRYVSYGSGALSTLRRGARLRLSPGYYTGDGPEAPDALAFWVESIEMTTGPAPWLIVQAKDAWWLLGRWRAKRQFSWPAGTSSAGQILQFICARAGLGLSSLNASDAIAGLLPAFTIHPGESGRTAIERLLAMIPDVAFAQAAAMRTRYPQAGDDSEYTYAAPAIGSTTEHAIMSGHYRDIAPATNITRIVGDGVYVEGFDFDEIESMGERSLQVIDVNLTDDASAGDRAACELRAAELNARRDEIRLDGVNGGQELYDVVNLTDAAAGLDAAERRVLALSWRYQTASNGGQPRYDMTLELGNP